MIPKIPNTSFANVVKNPFSYLLITVVSLVWYLLYFVLSNASTSDKNCLQEKNELRIELKQERTKNDNLINSILVKEGVIDRLTTITDSLNNTNHENK